MAGALFLVAGAASDAFNFRASLRGQKGATTFVWDLIGGPIQVPPPNANCAPVTSTALPVVDTFQVTVNGKSVAATLAVSGSAAAIVLTLTLSVGLAADNAQVNVSCKFNYATNS